MAPLCYTAKHNLIPSFSWVGGQGAQKGIKFCHLATLPISFPLSPSLSPPLCAMPTGAGVRTTEPAGCSMMSSERGSFDPILVVSQTLIWQKIVLPIEKLSFKQFTQNRRKPCRAKAVYNFSCHRHQSRYNTVVTPRSSRGSTG